MAKLVNLLLLQYNNYYNRIVKKEDSLDDYLEFQHEFVTGVSFNPNDGVNAEQIINWNEEWHPDYCIIVDEYNNIVSRWFINESQRTRGGQYKLTLFRDCIVDFYNDVVDAPCYIEKGFINDIYNPLLFNSEGIAYNQIKTSETLLRDKCAASWIVGYMSRDHGAVSSGPISAGAESADITDISVNTLNDWDVYNKYKEDLFVTNSSDANLCSWMTQYDFRNNKQLRRYKLRSNPSGITQEILKESISEDYWFKLIGLNGNFESVLLYNWNSIINLCNLSITHSSQDRQDFLALNGTYVRFLDGKIYQITISSLKTKEQLTMLPDADSALAQFIRTRLNESYGVREDSRGLGVYSTVKGYNIECNEVTAQFTASTTIPATSNKCSDAVYDMFAIAYKNANYNGRALDPNVAEQLATNFALELNSKLYDLQVLPYCPFENVMGDGEIVLTGLDNTKDYSLLQDSNNVVHAVVVYPKKCSFTRDIDFVILDKTTSIDKKIASETEMWRLCSPTYSGVFEFNPYKNNGVTKINIDCTYKPYNPYIHLNMDFAGLYGNDFDDSRGLICSGDFSFSVITEAWKTYELQNKNYESIFNRQIENMDVNNSIALTQAKWSVAGGMLGGAAAGALAGSKAGPYGAAIGAVVGGGTSVAAGIADVELLKKSQVEQRNYAIDMYNYNLQNIKALPYSLTKVSCLTFNFKNYPFVEMYDSSEEEKEALRNKILYNGMTVMKIDKISNFIDPDEKHFLQGQIIRLPNLDEDNHMAETIYAEIAKGVYI